MLIDGEGVAGNGAPLEVENPYTEETVASVGTADPEQLDAAFAAAREASREWARTPAVDRGELLARGRHAASRPHRRPRRGDDPGGRQAAGRELRRGQLDGRLLRLLRRDRPRFGGARHPLDRVQPALAGGEGAARRDRLHRPLELPAAAARLEDGAGAGGREHAGLQALRAHPALDPDARVLPRPSARRRRQPDRRRARGRAPRSPPSPGWTVSPSPARSRPGRRSRRPASTAWPASTSRWAARTRSSSARMSRIGSTSPPRAGPGPPS